MTARSGGVVVPDGVAAGAYPLSAAQYGIWFAQQRDVHTSYTVAQSIEVRGDLDTELLTAALVAAGHEFESFVLRLIEVGGRPFQVVDHSIDLSLQLIDLRASADPVTAARDWMRRDYTAPLDVLHDRLARGAVLRTGDQHYPVVLPASPCRPGRVRRDDDLPPHRRAVHSRRTGA